MQLGDTISAALAFVGVTENRVTAWLGKDCRCKERREKLNRLGTWAARIAEGKIEKAAEYLAEIIK